MTLSDDVDLEVFVMAKDDLSGADIKAICTEAGLLALRERRMKVRQTVIDQISNDLQRGVIVPKQLWNSRPLKRQFTLVAFFITLYEVPVVIYGQFNTAVDIRHAMADMG